MRWLPVVPALALVAGCAGSLPGADGRPQVVAAAYPFAWLAERITGADADVVDLVKPGAEPHDIELTPRQVARVKDADVVVYIEAFQAAVDDALEDGPQGLDLARVADVTDHDPHVWLDPVRMQAAAAAIADRLVAEDPAHTTGYRDREAAVIGDLQGLDGAFLGALDGCVRKELVTSHSAFGYLARRYGMVQRAISELTPDAEPSPRKVAEIAAYARSHGVTTIFFESLVDPKVARTVAAEIGARTAVLDPVESAHGSDDYLTIMRRNAAALHEALGCR